MDKPANRFYGEQRVEIKPGEYGNPHFHDHWHDIAGYATLSADRNK